VRSARSTRWRSAADRSASRRDAENELFDFACDLVEAAAGIARTAADPHAARAVPAVLGCIEEALEELSSAAAALRANAAPARLDERGRARVDRLERGYTNLSVALQDARDATRAARSLAARGSGGGGRRPQ
jgi:hypothetical protein